MSSERRPAALKMSSVKQIPLAVGRRQLSCSPSGPSAPPGRHACILSFFAARRDISGALYRPNRSRDGRSEGSNRPRVTASHPGSAPVALSRCAGAILDLSSEDLQVAGSQTNTRAARLRKNIRRSFSESHFSSYRVAPKAQSLERFETHSGIGLCASPYRCLRIIVSNSAHRDRGCASNSACLRIGLGGTRPLLCGLWGGCERTIPVSNSAQRAVRAGASVPPPG